jgi:hypothetical protein
MTRPSPNLQGVRLLLLALLAFSAARSQERIALPLGVGPGDGIRFVENRGQVVDHAGSRRPDILYTLSSGGTRLFFRRSGISYVYARVGSVDGSPDMISGYRMDMELLDGNPAAELSGEKRAPDLSNYYLAHCAEGITGVPSYGRIVYHDIYPNIDLTFYGDDRGLKYDFIVRPGGHPSDIALRYAGAGNVRMEGGRVVVNNPIGFLEEGSPYTYQTSGGDRSQVGTRYRLEGERISIEVDPYDSSRTLVIDPTLQWSTYYGGGQAEGITTLGSAMTADADGAIAMTGATRSIDFPVTLGAFQWSLRSPNGGWDAFIFKLGSDGRRLWSTYLGGSSDEGASGIMATKSGTLALCGWTQSADFPVSSAPFQATNAGSTDLYIALFDGAGARVWATYYGGSGNDEPAALYADSTGNIAITGNTASANFPVTGNAFQGAIGQQSDAFVLKFTTLGLRVWSTFFGGGGTDFGKGVVIDNLGNVIVTGGTYSSNLPISSGVFQLTPGGDRDAFIVKFDPTGGRRWSTYYGGSGPDEGDAVTVDASNNIIAVGSTRSYNFQTSPGAFQTRLGGDTSDAFVVKFDKEGIRQWGTLYGGVNAEIALGVVTGSTGDVFVAGITGSTNFPVTPRTYQQSLAGATDAFLLQLDQYGGQKWATYYGGADRDEAYALVLDNTGSIVVGGITFSNDLPGTAGGVQPRLGDATGDAFVAKFRDVCLPLNAAIVSSGALNLCSGDSVILTAPDGYTYQWLPSGKTTRSIVAKSTGIYRLTIVDANGCVGTSSVQVKVAPKVVASILSRGPTNLCQGDSVMLDAWRPGAVGYRWSNGATTPTITVRQTGAYTVLVTDSSGCSARSDTVQVHVTPRPAVAIAHGPLSFCGGDSVVLDAGSGFLGYRWSTGDTTQKISVKGSGVYKVKVMNTSGCWADGDSVVTRSYASPKLVVTALRPLTFCEGDSTILTAGSGFLRYRWSTGDTTRTLSIRRPGSYALSVVDSNGCSASTELKVRVLARPDPSIVANGPTRFCQGDGVTLDAGAGYAYYLWSTGESTRKIVVRESGHYTVTVANELGCSARSLPFDVRVYPRPSVSITGPVTACRGSNAVYRVDSIPGVRYLWTLSGPTGVITGGNGGPRVTVHWEQLGGAVLSLHIESDSTSCVADTAITVDVGSSLTTLISPNRSTRLCAGGEDSVTLDAGVFSSYLWSTGDTTRTITVAQPGEYTVTVSDPAGCSGVSKPISVSVNPRPLPQIAAPNGLLICQGDSITLDAGAGYEKYLWSNGATVQRITLREGGSYSVLVTDSNGCNGSSASVTVIVEQKPMPTVQGPTIVCRNSSIVYKAGTAPGHTYNWTVKGGTIKSGQGTSDITVVWGTGGVGSIEVTEIGTGGCSGDASTTVAVGDQLQPLIAPGAVVTLCPGHTVQLDAGAGYVSYLWSNGATTRTITVSDSGTFTVDVVDESGCIGTSAPASVIFGGAVHPVIAASSRNLCPDGSVTLDAGVGYAGYAWSNGATTQTIEVRDTGSYWVEVTDPNGCRGSSELVSVVMKSAPVPSVTPSGALVLCQGDSLRLEADPGFVGYRWSNGDTTAAIYVKEPGDYAVAVVDADGCSGRSENASVALRPAPERPSIAVKGDSLIATAAPYHQWTRDGAAIPGEGRAAMRATEPGRYAVIVRNEFGCASISDTVLIGEHRVVWFDSIEAQVGEHAKLTLRVDPPLSFSDGIRGYSVYFHLPPRSLFAYRAISPDGSASGDPAHLSFTAEGHATVTRPASSSPIVGDHLFQLDVEGLATAVPLNYVVIDSVSLIGGVGSVGGDGRVILTGCDLGRGFAFGKRVHIESIRPNPVKDEAIIVYRAPAGSQPLLRLRDMAGREFKPLTLPTATGDMQEARVKLGEKSSGLYMLELQQGEERTAAPMIIRK